MSDVVHVINEAFRGGDPNLSCPSRLDSAAAVSAWFEAAFDVIADSIPGEAAVRPLLDDLIPRIITHDPSAPDAILNFSEAMPGLESNGAISINESVVLMKAALSAWPIAYSGSTFTADAILSSYKGLSDLEQELNRCVDRSPNDEESCSDSFAVEVNRWALVGGITVAPSCSQTCKSAHATCIADALAEPQAFIRALKKANCAMLYTACRLQCALPGGP